MLQFSFMRKNIISLGFYFSTCCMAYTMPLSTNFPYFAIAYFYFLDFLIRFFRFISFSTASWSPTATWMFNKSVMHTIKPVTSKSKLQREDTLILRNMHLLALRKEYTVQSTHQRYNSQYKNTFRPTRYNTYWYILSEYRITHIFCSEQLQLARLPKNCNVPMFVLSKLICSMYKTKSANFYALFWRAFWTTSLWTKYVSIKHIITYNLKYKFVGNRFHRLVWKIKELKENKTRK